jgi:transcriptional regulator with XRE-family HTH domain
MELPKRIRAARGYARISAGELGRRLGVSESTIKRWEAGDLPSNQLAADALPERVADATGVPREFMLHGFGGVAQRDRDAGEILERVNTLLAGQAEAMSILRLLRQRVAGDGRSAQDAAPTPQPARRRQGRSPQRGDGAR